MVKRHELEERKELTFKPKISKRSEALHQKKLNEVTQCNGDVQAFYNLRSRRSRRARSVMRSRSPTPTKISDF